MKKLSIGYSDDVSVFLNGQILYRGRSAQNFRDPGFLGIVNPENDAVYLPLKKGSNELMLAVSELGGGWGFSYPLITEGSRRRLLSETDMSKPTDLVQGTLDLLLLKMLALQPLHGWAISLRLTAISGDVLQVSEGSLYPALHKLEQEGWIKAEWKQTENNRRAKFYALTRLGRKQLETETANWKRLSEAISHVVALAEA